MDSRVPVSVVGVGSKNAETPRKVGKGDGHLAPLEAISSLVTQLLDVHKWTLLFRFCHRGGRWMSEMANIERHRLMELDWGLLRETRDGPGGRVGPHWARARTSLGFEHTVISAIGEPFHEGLWTE